MKKKALFLIVFCVIVAFCFIISAGCKKNIVVIGGSTACLYEDDGQHLIKKSGWLSGFNSYIGYEYKIENFTKEGQSVSDVINTKDFEQILANLNKEDIVLLQIEEIDYTKEDFLYNLEYLIDLADNNGYKLILILPYHSEDYYLGKLKNILYQDDDVIQFDKLSNTNIIDPNFKEDTDRYKFVFSVYKDKNKGYDYEAFNYIFADCYGKALVDYINTGDFNIRNSSYKITRGMYISLLLKFANQEIITSEGDCFLTSRRQMNFMRK